MDNVSKAARSRIMAQVKGAGNRSTELAFIDILRSRRLHGWRRNAPVYGRPDFVFYKVRVAVFVDGCFWHACPQHCRLPASNRDYWESKIARNAKRDRHVTRELRKRGWTVLRFWEHELRGGGGRKLARLSGLMRQAHH